MPVLFSDRDILARRSRNPNSSSCPSLVLDAMFFEFEDENDDEEMKSLHKKQKWTDSSTEWLFLFCRLLQLVG
jgi:hypothetical protein